MSRVLIFTDDPRFATETQQALRGHTHHVRISPVSSVDVDAARDFGADVIVLDSWSNGGSVSLRQRLLTDHDLQRVPVVAVTNDLAYAQLIGAQAVVKRPIEPAALEAVVEQLSSRIVV